MAKVHVWDTLGQEKFRSVAPIFFKKSIGAFLVYDVTSKDSFEAIEEWYQLLLQHTDSRIIIMLLGNKKDKENREVPYNVGMQFAMSHNMGFMEVSAKQGIGIFSAFKCLVNQIYRMILLEQSLNINSQTKSHITRQ